MARRHRSYSLEFKRQVAQQYLTGDSRRAHSGYLYLCRLWIDKKRERYFARHTYWFGAHQALVACVYWTYLPLKIGARLSTNAVMPSM